MPANSPLHIVIWAFPSWNGDYMKSTVELAKELSLNNKVLYIDYAYSIKDVMAKSNPSIPVKTIWGDNNGINNYKLTNGGNINVLSLPPIIPFNWTNNKSVYRFIEHINNKLVAKRIKNALQALSFNPDIIVNAFNPFFGKASLSLFDSAPVVYYCYDNISASTWASKHGGWLEAAFAPKTKAIIFSSEALQQSKLLGIPSYVVKNGVDLRNFSQINHSKTTTSSTSKIIGYVGSVDERLDYDLLLQLALKNPNYQIRLVGRIIGNAAEKLSAIHNIQLVGAIAPSQLPAIIAQFDVGIIPFLKNDFTKNIYPMKVNEYLAVGLPVVATSFADLQDLKPYMALADEADSFGQQINVVLEADNDSLRNKRKEFAYYNNWENKAREFQVILEKYVGKKSTDGE